MASDEDVLDTEVADGVLDNGVGVKVSGRDNVADVAVHEDLARTKAHDLVGRHTAVSASKVEVLRLLRTTDSLYIELEQTTIQHNRITEVLGVLGSLGLDPLLVVREDGGEIIATCRSHDQILNFKLNIISNLECSCCAWCWKESISGCMRSVYEWSTSGQVREGGSR